MNDEMLDFMLSHMDDNKHPMQRKDTTVKNEVDMEEAIQIFDELIAVLTKHNVSYQLGCRLSLALNEAFISGAVELMGLDGFLAED